MRGGRLSTRRTSPFSDSDVNPMDGLSNLSDAMLVLAVGIMLALVTAWNVDISLTDPGEAADANVTAVEEVQELEEADLQDPDEAENDATIPGDGSGLTEYGKVYVDQDGNYYVEPIEEGGNDQ